MIAVWSLDPASFGIGAIVGFILGCIVITLAAGAWE